MAKAIVLTAQRREQAGTRAARRFRRSHQIPAVLYGHQEATVALLLDERELQDALKARAKTLDLTIDGQTEKVLIREVQQDATSDKLLHIDFTRIAADEEVTVTIPIELVGEPKGVHDGGILEVTLHEVEVSCLPANVPDNIRIHIEELGIDEPLHAGDLPMPAGVTCTTQAQEVVAVVHRPVEAPVEEEALAEETGEAGPEVIAETKAEERKTDKDKEGKAE